ncbi:MULTISPECIES: MFS transporter [unclassified Oceanispirochaeta]|uniref:MFS transporter n=1 Tax=unclassified Oceanispirochaeta TaxID=2635722 RepID=UPI000E09E055|nr:MULTISPECIES: glycoside-pentoside-hexuronide (GPH):cation symporter [unclassified Oceanispirochaeta]MBF9015979.1 MFS transporter [Oceanispirochaeta sp. M2]NPD72442.1 MFS transporter [Oceanispirochaeta sp. M1]RDG31904.1 MFS transporter [Oceanispirochaeta sp. M1]
MKPGYVVPMREKLAFGVGDLAINIAFTTIGFYFIFFIVNVAGLRAEWAGIIFACAKLWDAITDYYMGILSDRTKSRFGRRRPYILAGSIPLAISFALLWIVPFQNPVALFIYYMIIILIFNTAFTVVSVPYNALLPELSSNYNERTNITGFRMSFAFIGNLIAAAGVALIVDVIFGGAENYDKGYPAMGVILGVIILVILIITFLGTKERKKEVSENKDGFLGTIKALLSMKEFRMMLGMFLFSMIAIDIFMAVVLFFLKDVVHISDDIMFLLMGVPLVLAVVAAPLWVYLGEKLGKRNAYAISAVLFALILLLFFVAPVGNVVYVTIIAMLAGLGISASQIIPWSIMPDINEIDEHRNGVRREGAVYGITIFLYKSASAIAILLVSSVLGIFGYIEGTGAVQPESAVKAIRILIGIAPGICSLIAAFFALKLPLSKDQFDQMRLEIEERKAVRKAVVVSS